MVQSGELDLSSRNQLFVAATTGNDRAMVIDLADLNFMDCSGYGGLVACVEASSMVRVAIQPYVGRRESRPASWRS